MPAGVDITGKKFNRLTAISKKYSTGRGVYWTCACDCGTIAVVCFQDLKSGHTKSCGCLLEDSLKSGIRARKPFGDSARNMLYAAYQNSARYRKLEWNLNKENFLYLVAQPCFYCGESPNRVYKPRSYSNGGILVNGIDRINNELGYLLDNCVSCCSMCNKAKNTLTKEEFISWIERVYNYTFGDIK